MIMFIIVLLIILVGLIYVSSIFFWPVVELAINLPILIYIYYRAKRDLLDDEFELEYLAGILLAGAVFLVTFMVIAKIPFVWPITIFLLLMYVIAKILISHRIQKRITGLARKRIRHGTLHHTGTLRKRT